jgi:hypothetical protein
MRQLLALILFAFAVTVAGVPVQAASTDVKIEKKKKAKKHAKKKAATKPVAKKKSAAKQVKAKEEKASAGGTAAGAPPAPDAGGTDLGLQAEREEARIRRKLNSGDVDGPGE